RMPCNTDGHSRDGQLGQDVEGQAIQRPRLARGVSEHAEAAVLGNERIPHFNIVAAGAAHPCWIPHGKNGYLWRLKGHGANERLAGGIVNLPSIFHYQTVGGERRRVMGAARVMPASTHPVTAALALRPAIR